MPDKIVIPTEYSGLNEIKGISISSGLTFCGSWKAFDKFLSSFYIDIPYKASELENSFKNRDFNLFTTKVHALKTSAKIIGANTLSDEAALLERAGESNNLCFIEDNIDDFLSHLRSYEQKLSKYMYDKNNSKKDSISPDELVEARIALLEISSAMDYDGLELIIETLNEYKLSAHQQEIVNNISYYLRKFDWQKVSILINEL
ncbi:Hpt domain-containing protein [Pseudobutyrivibrio sp. YE44]|uniref:Hpt domain-containing protein n=1 Tax=Pseudobutyrivibrio sp. YE44 TaxID=1520802 RepID=UPI00115FAB88|nr:hypothetical protein [Pseudobutyrivibrio sp. YE44]